MNKREAYQLLLNGGRVRHSSWGKATYVYMDEGGRIRWDDEQPLHGELSFDDYIDVSPPMQRTYYLSTDDLGRVVLGKEHLEAFCGLQSKKVKVTITEVKETK